MTTLMHDCENPKEAKAIVEKAFFGDITPQVPASILQLHNDVTFVVDEDTSTTESFEYDSTIDFIPTKQHYEFCR